MLFVCLMKYSSESCVNWSFLNILIYTRILVYYSEKLGNRLRDSSKSGDFLLETEDFPELSKSQVG